MAASVFHDRRTFYEPQDFSMEAGLSMAMGSSMTAGLSMVTFYESMTAAAAVVVPIGVRSSLARSLTAALLPVSTLENYIDKNKLPAAAQQQHKKNT
jgi:hypothetical protein